VLVMAVAGSSVAAAEAVPPERWAIGSGISAFKPIGSDDYKLEPAVQGFAEYLQSEAIAWRATVVWVEFAAPDDREAGDIGLLAFLANFVYRWDADAIHPLLTAGVGLYEYDPERGERSSELGVNLGGGVEIELHPQIGIELQASVHGTAGDEPDTIFSASAAIRWRF
jgi:hypothetical protein